MTGFFDGPNPFENQAVPTNTGGGGFFDGPNPFEGGGFFDQTPEQFAQANQQAADASPFGRALYAVGVVGKTLQPFAAPQQLLFGGIGSLEDLMTGQGAEAAWNTLKRGGSSALAYATYQHGGDLPGVLKNKSAPQSNPIFGYELFKKVGAPDWVARWGGTAADFLVDPLLLTGVGKATKLDGLTRGLRVGENMAESFTSPGALRAFAGGVAAAPFTTQPIKRFVEAVPLGLRQAGKETLIDPLLTARSVPRREFDPVNPTVAQTLFDRYRGVPEPVVDILERKTAIASQLTVLENQAALAFHKVNQGLPFETQKELGALAGRLADESDPALRAAMEGQIRALEARTSRAGLADSTIQAVNKGIQFDVFAAEKLTGAGLMSPEQLLKYQSGDQRHLRRVLAMYGERPEDQIRRVLDRNAPASITFDNAGLEQLYGLTLNPRIPPPPPLTGVAKSELTNTRVGAFPSRTPLLDPVADAARPVWRDVTRDVQVGTVDRAALDLGNLGRSEVTSLRNILGWDAVKQVGGKWRVVGGVDDSFPVTHPVIESLFGDLKAQGLADNLRTETRSFKEQVPNYFDPKSGATLEMQRALADEEIAAAQGALYVHGDDMTPFMAGATPEELAAFEAGLERLPMKEQTRRIGKNDVTDSWFPVDPTDPALTRLIERARGGGAALFGDHPIDPAKLQGVADQGIPVYRGEITPGEYAGIDFNMWRPPVPKHAASPAEVARRQTRLGELTGEIATAQQKVDEITRQLESADVFQRMALLLPRNEALRKLGELTGESRVIKSLLADQEGNLAKEQTAIAAEAARMAEAAKHRDLLYVTPDRDVAADYAKASFSDAQGQVRELRINPQNMVDLRPLTNEAGYIKTREDLTGILTGLGFNTGEVADVFKALESVSFTGAPGSRGLASYELFRGEATDVMKKALRRNGIDAVRYQEIMQDNIVLLDRSRAVETLPGGALKTTDPGAGRNQQALPVNPAALSKTAVTLPTPQEFAAKVQEAYTNPDQHPADFLNSFLREKGMGDAQVTRIIEGIGHDYAKKAGLDWRPSDEHAIRAIARKRAESAGEGAGQTPGGAQLGGRGTAAVTTARVEISDAYLDVLGEVEDFATRLTAQSRAVSRAVTVNGTVRDIRSYLLENDLIEQLGTADLGSIYRTAGMRVVSAEQARALGNGFKEGEVLPAEIHRILLETVSTRKEAPLGLAWQWFSSRWQGVKLANPGSIATNIKSGFVMANQVGINPVDLGRGIADYLRLHRAAVKGDGALDVAARVNGVTMRELFHHGAFTHNTLLNAEVTQRSSRLMDELANPAGSSLQRNVAALQNWLTETERGAKTAAAYRTAVTPMRWLGDTYGRVDSVMKGGLYMHLRRQGIKPEQAARMADETFFNYQAVPYVVDGLRRFGLLGMPFASFKFLAAGRFFKNLYNNPYGVDRFYRLPNSSLAALRDQPGEAEDKSAYDEYAKGSPDYVRQGLYIPLGKDSQGRYRAVRLDDILPETAVFDSFNADGVAGTIPPAVQLAAQIVTGKGYQGRDLYRTGKGWAETQQLDPQEAARGVVAALWQFGAYPWMPGQPMTERLVKALADKSVPVDTITDPKAQTVLKIMAGGPAGIRLLDPAAFSTERAGTQAVPDVADAIARTLGVKAYPVTTSTGEPGTARSNQVGLEADLQALDRMMSQEMRSAQSDEQRREIQARYRQKRERFIQKLRAP